MKKPGTQTADARLIAPHLHPSSRTRWDMYCYFDNEPKTHAPFDAQRLTERLGLRALHSVA